MRRVTQQGSLVAGGVQQHLLRATERTRMRNGQGLVMVSGDKATCELCAVLACLKELLAHTCDMLNRPKTIG